MLENYYIAMLAIQLFHSIEELTRGFHEKFPPFKMSFKFFLNFEIMFYLFWLFVLVFQRLPHRDVLMAFFVVLMFANGLWHLVWAGIVRKYVPGLITAPFFVIVFLAFCFQIIMS